MTDDPFDFDDDLKAPTKERKFFANVKRKSCRLCGIQTTNLLGHARSRHRAAFDNYLSNNGRVAHEFGNLVKD